MPKPPFHFVPLPRSRSTRKPRASGRTMIIDDGLPLAWTRDLVALAGEYIDLAKIKTGTARLYPRAQLVQKLRFYKKNRIQPFLGGQFHEYVYATQGAKALPGYYDESLKLGFEAIEISDNVVPLADAERRRQIRAAVAAGLIVYGEVGSKETMSNPSLLVRQAEICFSAGAALVLVEAAELVEKGKLRKKTIDLLVRSLDLSRVMIELPGPWISDVRSCDIEDMKKALVVALGPDVNLANVPPASIIDTEATRTGLGTAGPPKSR
ncbi:MAG TPA: phosphosulfolactate synthase [Burkholderiales bacterium]|jgi:phosphosulfolactate synthase|nr:phosphosulfolactate synthase [Burkholderiales bacterium]